MNTTRKARSRWLTLGGAALLIIATLAALHFAINGNIIGWIAALHGQ